MDIKKLCVAELLALQVEINAELQEREYRIELQERASKAKDVLLALRVLVEKEYTTKGNIPAIKLMREYSGFGLHPAKDVVEAWAREAKWVPGIRRIGSPE